ncbi:MAG: ergothioneine biosynthesis protein EgtB [Cyanobacteria bacterium RYN_339]|nr:ergothioneine biosynthesis protein EgtB [Cyanobacteria bacterium RYN_339]
MRQPTLATAAKAKASRTRYADAMLAETENLTYRFARVRARTEQLFAIASAAADHLRPIPLRHPLIFYFGHLDAFIVNTLFRGALQQAGQHEAFDDLFARGIDPADAAAAEASGQAGWPAKREIAAYREAVQRRLQAYLREPGPKPHHVMSLLLEHELMHQETLFYLIHQLPSELKHKPPGDRPAPPGLQRVNQAVTVPAGPTWLGVPPGFQDFYWDNEGPGHEAAVAAFEIDALPVTNADYRAFMNETDATAPFYWLSDDTFRGTFGPQPLDPMGPALVTHAQAAAYAAWAGAALPTEAQWQRAAYGDDAKRRYPWGDAAPGPQHGNFGFQRYGPTRVGAFPAGDSAFGVAELVGNGWEWTSTPFAPYPGFAADPHYPGYSADFFDGRHMVLKGASWATDPQLLRRSFRNWFFPDYPYVYAKFRLVRA